MSVARILLILAQLFQSSHIDFFTVRNKERLEGAGSKFNAATPCFNTIGNTRKVRDKQNRFLRFSTNVGIAVSV